MYTVIVADDEEEIRRGIIKKVKWEELGFQVIGEAANGADALELVEKLEPDLLLTDMTFCSPTSGCLSCPASIWPGPCGKSALPCRSRS